ncbi:MAG TPA: hypothetical protein VM936_01505 [Pyrinomonadaceae bacterium]|jgi:hypothetical protein|nr:hypothetical protein [Pyrinomonadaceae bacterium]
MADHLSDDEVQEIISKVMPGYRVVNTGGEQDAGDSTFDAVERTADAVSPGVRQMQEGASRAAKTEDASDSAGRSLADILQDFSQAARRRDSSSGAGQNSKRDRVVSIEPEGRRDLSDRKSRVKSVVISGETGDIDIRQG